MQPFCSTVGFSPSGCLPAASAADWVMSPTWTIRWSTWLRRSSAVFGLLIGSYAVGFSTSPASSADCASVSFDASVLK